MTKNVTIMKFDLEKKIQDWLLSLPYVDECIVKSRQNKQLSSETIAYIIPSILFTELESKILTDLPSEYQPLVCVSIPSFPLNQQGDIDYDLLCSIPVVDSLLIHDFEEEILETTALPAVVFYIKRASKRNLLYLPDFIESGSPSHSTISELGRTERQQVSVNTKKNQEVTKALSNGVPLLKTPETPILLTDMLRSLSTRIDSEDIIFISETGGKTCLSYGELYKKACSISSQLQLKGINKGVYAIFQLEENFDFIVVFWGCLLAGVIPIPLAIANSYSEKNPAVERLANVCGLFSSAAVILTSQKLESKLIKVQTLLSIELCSISVIDTSVQYDGEMGQPIVSNKNDTAFVMLTSGSTGEPKGVCISHDNLISRSMSTCIINQLTAEMTALNWMSLDHVAGLVMCHLRSVYLGCQQIHVETDFILNDPLRWLDLLEQYKVGVTFAPNFAYALIVERESDIVSRHWDLSATKLFQNGGEAVSVHVARKFIDILTKFNFYPAAMGPAWGMSETTSGVTFNNNFLLDNTSDDDPYVSVGLPMPGNSLRIVDEKNQIINEGMVGRIQVKGSAVFSGYYTGGDLNTSCFTRDGWFMTGDLGYIDAGSLTITGREKDVIIIGGVNYSGISIETSIASIKGIRNSFVAAVSVPHREQNNQECLAILFVPEGQFENEKIRYIFQQIRSVLGKQIGVFPEYIVPLDEVNFLKTSIGKIQRTKMQVAFTSGQYDSEIRKFELLVSSKNTMVHWFTENKWLRKNLTKSYREFDKKTIIYIGDNVKTVNQFQTQYQTIWLKPSSSLQGINQSLWEINCRNVDDYLQAFEQFDSVSIIIADFFSSAEDQFKTDLELSILQTNLTTVLLKSIDRFSFKYLSKLLVVGSSARTVVSTDYISPACATVIGLIKSFSIEQEKLKAFYIDFDRQDSGFIINSICEEMLDGGFDVEVAYRNGDRYVPSVVPLDPRPCQNSVLLMNGCYLISGGLGGIGFHLVSFLLNQYFATVILVGRSNLMGTEGSNIEKNKLFKELKQLPGDCHYLCLDINDQAALQQGVSHKLQDLGADLNGIFHLAGRLKQSLIADVSEVEIQDVFSAKIQGTANLYSLLDNKQAIFVAFSSIRSIVPAATLGVYAAANIYLDEFIRKKNNNSNPRSYCINWSAWHNTGLMAGSNDESIALEHLGILELSVDKAIASLSIILTQQPGQYIVGLDCNNHHIQKLSHQLLENDSAIQVLVESDNAKTIDKIQLLAADRFGTKVQLLKRVTDYFLRTATGEIDKSAILVEEGFKQEVIRLPQSKAENEIAEMWKEIFHLGKVSVDWNFFELGGNSIMVTRLVAKLNDLYTLGLRMKDVFELPSIEAQAKRVEEQGNHDYGHYVINKRPEQEDTFPVSSSQGRLWFMEQVEPSNPAYHVFASVVVKTHFDHEKLTHAINLIVKRHEVLRTCFINEQGVPLQKIYPELGIPLPIVSISASLTEEQIIEAEMNKPFDLEKGSLLRCLLIKTTNNREVLFLTIHHIISDGWSMKILFNELSELYFNAEPITLDPIPLHYGDFSYWQNQHLAKDSFNEQVSYWKQKLQHHLNGFGLPLDKPRPVIQSYEGRRIEQVISGDLYKEIKVVVKEHNVTPFVFLLTAFNSMLSRYTQERDVIVGTVAANRDNIAIQKTIGFFINPLVLYTEIDQNKKFSEVLQDVQKVIIDAYDNHDIPFESLVDILHPVRDTSRPPLFQIVFDVRDPEITQCRYPDVDFSVMEPFIGKVQYDLHIVVIETEGQFRVCWDYNTDLFLDSTITRMGNNYITFLSSIVNNSYKIIKDLQLISANEKAQVEHWNNTEAKYAADKCMHQLFEEHAKRTPEQLALMQFDKKLNYAELNAVTNQWARYLISKGVGKDCIVGICFNRSIESIVSILAVLKAGGAYLALDPTYPKERVQFMINDASPKLILTSREFLGSIEQTRVAYILMENVFQSVVALDDSNVNAPVFPDHLAYIIYTSGSTGKPKGVFLEHKGWCNVAQSQIDSFGLTPGMRVLQFASWSFDASAFEFAMAYGSGGSLILGDEKGFIPGNEMAQFLQDKKVEVVTLPPSALSVLPKNSSYPSLKVITVAGEECPLELVNNWATTERRFFNLYGPTETTIWASYYECHQGMTLPPAIGIPVNNTKLYVLDHNYQQLPVGMPGELCITGVGLARGYINREELTAERFIKYSGLEEKKRLYCTGDLVRLNNNGLVEFLGRIDRQIKIRGFRVEPGEIEAILKKNKLIKNALVVKYLAIDTGDKLVAYLISNREKDLDINIIKLALSEQLPNFMVPNDYVVLAEFPLTHNGKIDYKALPDPRNNFDTEYVRSNSQTAQEEIVEKVWCNVLSMDKIDINQNFFDIGGHSLKLAQIQSELGLLLDREIKLMDLFQYVTIKSLAAFLSDSTAQEKSVDSVKDTPLIKVKRNRPSLRSFADKKRNSRKNK